MRDESGTGTFLGIGRRDLVSNSSIFTLVRNQSVTKREPKSNIFEFNMEENRCIEACKLEGVDARIDTAKPILLREALMQWSEEGELKGDGWSKRRQAEIAKNQATFKRSHKKGGSRSRTSTT